MPIASRLGVPVFRKKSEKYSIVSIKALITHRFEEEDATKIFSNYIRKAGLSQRIQHAVLMKSICCVLIS
jgi:hypothetical protein